MKQLRKRKFAMVTILCLSFLLLISQAAFAADSVKLSASTVSGTVGEEVTVTIRIANAKETEGGQFDLSFDPDILQPKKDASNNYVITEGSFVSNASNSMPMANVVGNLVKFAWITPNGAPTDEGVVCTIVFKLLDDGIVNLNFSGVVIAPDGVEVATAHTSGKVTVTDAASAKQAAIDAAIAAIAALPTDIKLTDKDAVVAARALVNSAKSNHGAVDADFTNLAKLVAAEAAIAKLEAIKAACDAVLALPTLDKLTLNDKPDVVAARALVNSAKTNHGAVDADFTCLTALAAAENRVRELEGLQPTPSTGEAHYLLFAGLVILLVGLAVRFKRSSMDFK